MVLEHLFFLHHFESKYEYFVAFLFLLLVVEDAGDGHANEHCDFVEEWQNVVKVVFLVVQADCFVAFQKRLVKLLAFHIHQYLAQALTIFDVRLFAQ